MIILDQNISNDSFREQPRVQQENRPEEEFVSICWENDVYRVPKNNYHRVETFVLYVLAVIGLFAICCLTFMAFDLFNIQVNKPLFQFYSFLGTFSIGFIIINSWLIEVRKISDNKFKASIICLNIYLFVLTYLFAYEIDSKCSATLITSKQIFIQHS